MSDVPDFTNLVLKYLLYVDDKTRVDIDVMTHDLKYAFSKYSKLPHDSFKANLEAAYLEVLKKLGLSVSKMRPFTPPSTFSWENMGAHPHGQLAQVKRHLQDFIREPYRSPRSPFYSPLSPVYCPDTSVGILLHGPSGCGKTMMVKTLATDFDGSFISIKCPELINPYIIGETEEAIALAFRAAKDSAPCILFLDEIDVLCWKRTSDVENDGRSNERENTLLRLLAEIEGMRNIGQTVHLLAATNKRSMMDPVFFRNDTFNTLFINFPQALDRMNILRTITKNGTDPAVAHDVDFSTIGSSNELDKFTGADLQKLVQEAQMIASINESPIITNEHFDFAIFKVQASKRRNGTD